MSIPTLILIGIIAFMAFHIWKGFRHPTPGLICTACGSQAGTRSHTRGSFLIELILWLCFLIPGLIYSIWRLTTRRDACLMCGSAALVPVESPVGRELASRYQK